MPKISSIPCPFYRTYDALENTGSSFCSCVDFGNELTEKELSYARLVARTNFHQLVLTAQYMIDETISFTEATKKYLIKFK